MGCMRMHPHLSHLSFTADLSDGHKVLCLSPLGLKLYTFHPGFGGRMEAQGRGCCNVQNAYYANQYPALQG